MREDGGSRFERHRRADGRGRGTRVRGNVGLVMGVRARIGMVPRCHTAIDIRLGDKMWVRVGKVVNGVVVKRAESPRGRTAGRRESSGLRNGAPGMIGIDRLGEVRVIDGRLGPEVLWRNDNPLTGGRGGVDIALHGGMLGEGKDQSMSGLECSHEQDAYGLTMSIAAVLAGRKSPKEDMAKWGFSSGSSEKAGSSR